MLQDLADFAATLPGRAILAVDGVDGAGKTTFADQLRPLIEARGRPAVRASVDGFHNPRSIRYRRGKSDPLGFFLDSYNYGDLTKYLIEPFRRGDSVIETQRFDHRSDGPAVISERVEPSSILVLDGIFLHRDELWTVWDYSVFLNVPFDQSFQRMAQRDGSDPDPGADSNKRYRQGQMIYLDQCKPQERASLVLDW